MALCNILISQMFMLAGPSWSIFLWFGKCRSWTFYPTNFETRIWIWEEEIDKRWCQRLDISWGATLQYLCLTSSFHSSNFLTSFCSDWVDIRVSSPNATRVSPWWGPDQLHVPKVRHPLHEFWIRLIICIWKKSYWVYPFCF